EAQAACDGAIRQKYDREHRVAGTVLAAETGALLSAVEAEIIQRENARSEREEHGKGTSNWLAAGILEELQLARVTRQLEGLTLSDVSHLYQAWTDETDRTAIRLLEGSIADGLVSRLRLRPDPESDAEALLQLRKSVGERRRGRVPAALVSLRDR